MTSGISTRAASGSRYLNIMHLELRIFVKQEIALQNETKVTVSVSFMADKILALLPTPFCEAIFGSAQSAIRVNGFGPCGPHNRRNYLSSGLVFVIPFNL